MSKVHVVTVQQLPLPAGQHEDPGGGETDEEAAPGEQVAVPVQQTVSITLLHHQAGSTLHQLNHYENTDCGEEVEHSSEASVDILGMVDAVPGEDSSSQGEQHCHP